MILSQRIKFYSIGVFIGVFVVYVLFGKDKMSCSYFPNARVLEECYNKPKEYSNQSIKQLNQLGLDSVFIQKNIFVNSKIDFKNSEQRKKPCGIYITYYPKKNPEYQVIFKKCKNKVIISSISKL